MRTETDLAMTAGPETLLAKAERLLASIPQSLPLLALRFALAVPFYKSGLTKWDGFLQLSGGAEFLFTSEFRLHILGQQYPVSIPLSGGIWGGDRRNRAAHPAGAWVSSHALRRLACW